MNLHQQIGAIFDRAAKPSETVIERASRVMAENQREIERLTHELAEARRMYKHASIDLPRVLQFPFEIEVLHRPEQPFGPDPYPAEYTTKTASPDIVLDCVNALLEKHDDELLEMVREAQLRAWER
jgi:hypothetical protein